jgi:hypothetical protein
MSESSNGLTSTDLLAAASHTLTSSGYKHIRDMFPEWDTPTSRLFEDRYNVVGIVVFATCGDLLREWPDRQASLVDVISSHVGRAESKSWDGYLVLLTPGLAPSETAELDAVRYDTTRLRKLIATGDDLTVSTDVERVLSSLLPLGEEPVNMSQESTLDLLPTVLAERGVSEGVTQILINAFREQLPLLEELHDKRGG